MECRFCSATFYKGEHLRRHERTHTGAKPFACSVCKRAFSRQDSLARHERLHTRQSTSLSANTVPTSAQANAHPITPESLDSHEDVSGGPTQEESVTNSDLMLPFELIWPGNEDLFRTIMSTEMTTFSTEMQMPIDPAICSASLSGGRVELDSIPSGGNQRAVQDVSNMISNMSSSVTAAAEATSVSSVYLDECLHLFFERFIPTFPILHRATFVFKDFTQQLLLNAIAIGSLYLGPKDAVAKGETLWRLAHTAIATSWQSLISHRGPYDSCPGVQLVLSALLSQIYGTLSRNRSIRSTSQAFQAMSFVWARNCGMFDISPYDLKDLPLIEASKEEKDRQWRIWAAREIQQRALLAHYILDGLISHMTGEPTTTRHVTTPLVMSSCECGFEADTADAWITHMRSQSSSKLPFRRLLHILFRPLTEAPHIDHTFTAFSFRVLMEGIQSLIVDCDGDVAAVGVPSKAEVQGALGQLYQNIMSNLHLSSADRLETILRWHTICLDTIIDSSLLCRHVCNCLNVEQQIWRPGKKLSGFDISSWATTSNARRALLHAIAIQDIIEQLPRGRAHVIHMPSSLMAASTVYATFSRAALQRVKVPSRVIWSEVLLDLDQPYFTLAEMSNPALVSDTVRFIRGESFFGAGASKNLLYELNSIQKLFRCLYSQWGIAFDMESVVDQWIKACRGF